MHYGAVFKVLSVVSIEVKALNLLGSDVTQQFPDVSVEPTVCPLGGRWQQDVLPLCP
jgi:hypothetical protein